MKHQQLLAARLQAVWERIQQACARVQRDPRAVRMVVVSKTASMSQLMAARQLGIADFGESRVQQAVTRIEACPATWHMIGRVQRTKAAMVAAHFSYLHSLDRLPLAEVLARHVGAQGRTLRVFLQVNLAGETQKAGFAPGQVAAALEALRAWPCLQVVGLMTMAPHYEQVQHVRPIFAELRNLRDQLVQRGAELPELSMGMSHDFPVAVEEGATWLRIGSALFSPTIEDNAEGDRQ